MVHSAPQLFKYYHVGCKNFNEANLHISSQLYRPKLWPPLGLGPQARLRTLKAGSNCLLVSYYDY